MARTVPDPVAAAREASLRYVTDDQPGFGRRRSGRGFSYRDLDGRTIRDAKVVERIKALAIPPAWTDVWICPNPRGHIQATGRDARGRKQYRYHPDWRAVRDATKFDRMAAFGAALPELRERIDEDLALRGIPREKVLAAVLRLIDLALLRVGNEEYARLNESFGAATLRDDHVVVKGEVVRFAYRGKHGREVQARIADRRIARIARRCQELPGEELFAYVDELGEPRDVRSDDVNAYLRELTADEFSVKDFRTWGASVLALGLLSELGPPSSDREATAWLGRMFKIVAASLGNTPAVCRSSYVLPAVPEAWRDGKIDEARLDAPGSISGLREAEVALLELAGGERR